MVLRNKTVAVTLLYVVCNSTAVWQVLIPKKSEIRDFTENSLIYSEPY